MSTITLSQEDREEIYEHLKWIERYLVDLTATTDWEKGRILIGLVLYHIKGILKLLVAV